MKKAVTLFAMLVFSTLLLHSEVTITVPSGFSKGNGTCLARLYSDVLEPANYAGAPDATSPTQFAQSIAGTMGLTIFYENRPNVYGTSTAFAAAMAGTGYVAINRYHAIGFLDNRLHDLKSVTKNMSIIWSLNNSNRYNGTADLLPAENTLLKTILSGSQSDGNCDGLIWSFNMAQSVLYTAGLGDSGHTVFRGQCRSYFPKSLWFNASGNNPGGELVGSVQIPSCGATRTVYFWTKPGIGWNGDSY